MLTNILLDHQWLSPTALVLVLVLGPLVGSRLAGRPSSAWLVAGLATVPLVILTLLPQHHRAFRRCELSLGSWNWPTPSRVELLANVVLFVAPVLFVAVATRRPALAFLAGSLASVGVEALQAVVTGIGRSCDANDWITNTMGALLGAVLGALALHRASSRRRGVVRQAASSP